jgi:hypothetical protein
VFSQVNLVVFLVSAYLLLITLLNTNIFFFLTNTLVQLQQLIMQPKKLGQHTRIPCTFGTQNLKSITAQMKIIFIFLDRVSKAWCFLPLRNMFNHAPANFFLVTNREYGIADTISQKRLISDMK